MCSQHILKYSIKVTVSNLFKSFDVNIVFGYRENGKNVA